jgi:hypothetical protein
VDVSNNNNNIFSYHQCGWTFQSDTFADVISCGRRSRKCMTGTGLFPVRYGRVFQFQLTMLVLSWRWFVFLILPPSSNPNRDLASTKRAHLQHKENVRFTIGNPSLGGATRREPRESGHNPRTRRIRRLTRARWVLLHRASGRRLTSRKVSARRCRSALIGCNPTAGTRGRAQTAQPRVQHPRVGARAPAQTCKVCTFTATCWCATSAPSPAPCKRKAEAARRASPRDRQVSAACRTGETDHSGGCCGAGGVPARLCPRQAAAARPAPFPYTVGQVSSPHPLSSCWAREPSRACNECI